MEQRFFDSLQPPSERLLELFARREPAAPIQRSEFYTRRDSNETTAAAEEKRKRKQAARLATLK